MSASTSGTTIAVTVTGGGSVAFSCSGGSVAINDVVALPALACTALTKVTVTGDAGSQQVYGSQLNGFSGHPTLTASMGDGADTVHESTNADTIATGPGDDVVALTGGTNNVSVDLGSGSGDTLYVGGSMADDVMTLTSSGASTTATRTTGAATSTNVVAGPETLVVHGYDGNDTITTAGVTAASALTTLFVHGDEGNDTLTGGPKGEIFETGEGMNMVWAGGGQDTVWSQSATDVIDGGSDTLVDMVHDTTSLRSGGRLLTGFGTQDALDVQAITGDATMRIRPSSGGTALATMSLTRTGQQVVPASLGTVGPTFGEMGEVPHRAILDVVASNHRVSAQGGISGRDLLDVTIPSGTWVATGIGPSVQIIPDDPAYQTIAMSEMGAYRIHGPWTDKARGFAHRATRDLVFRFASDAALDDLQAKLTSGERTRAQVTAGLMGTDEYRGLDVDRTFVKYLRRVPDPGGRTYWINGIRNGKALWRFRAQLFGSNEYFTKAGGTNSAYVQRAYADVLGRTPDRSGQAYWTGKLDKGADRGSVALQFINSPEARRRLVDDQFLRFLDRYPTEGEQATWVAKLPATTGEQDLIAFLVNSSGYYKPHVASRAARGRGRPRCRPRCTGPGRSTAAARWPPARSSRPRSHRPGPLPARGCGSGRLAARWPGCGTRLRRRPWSGRSGGWHRGRRWPSPCSTAATVLTVPARPTTVRASTNCGISRTTSSSQVSV